MQSCWQGMLCKELGRVNAEGGCGHPVATAKFSAKPQEVRGTAQLSYSSVFITDSFIRQILIRTQALLEREDMALSKTTSFLLKLALQPWKQTISKKQISAQCLSADIRAMKYKESTGRDLGGTVQLRVTREGCSE